MENEFNKIAGYKEEKKELLDLCNIIKRREELNRAGGKLPRGLFLYGPTGVGKTKLARAFIRETKCPFIEINSNDATSGLDFSGYIKAKFKEAVSKVPCVIFIDELDKLIGQHSDPFFSSLNDRSKDLLNEINRYADVEGLFLLFVANNEYMIDAAIVRSGRIDRKIRIANPNEIEREEILRYYSKNKRFDESVDLSNVARMTRGFSGADLESLLNDAVMKSMTNMHRFVTNEDIMGVYNDKTFSCKSKDFNLSKYDQKLLAYHEAGHAAMSLLCNKEAVFYATIISRGMTSGYVAEETNDKRIETIDDFKRKAKICLAGMASEQIFLRQRSTGSSSDIHRANGYIKDLICTFGIYGFDKVRISDRQNDFGMVVDDRSEYKKTKTEKAESKLFVELYESTKQSLINNRRLVKNIAKALIEKKVLDKKDLRNIYQEYKSQKSNKKGNSMSRCDDNGTPLYN